MNVHKILSVCVTITVISLQVLGTWPIAFNYVRPSTRKLRFITTWNGELHSSRNCAFMYFVQARLLHVLSAVRRMGLGLGLE